MEWNTPDAVSVTMGDASPLSRGSLTILKRFSSTVSIKVLHGPTPVFAGGEN
jgi:hypothetical protein